MNAVEPVSMLIVGRVDVIFRRTNDGIENLRVAGAERNDCGRRRAEGRCRRGSSIAANKDPAFVAYPLDPVFEFA